MRNKREINIQIVKGNVSLGAIVAALAEKIKKAADNEQI